MKPDIYREVTDKIVAQIEGGAGELVMPFNAIKIGLPQNATTGATYRGVNVLSLWCAAEDRGYPTNLWATYRQWAGIGAQVRKGERGTMIVYAGTSVARDPSEDGDDAVRTFKFLKRSHVFNAAQVDGYQAEPAARPGPAERIAAAERYVAATGAVIRYDQGRPFYAHPPRDFIGMPELGRFHDTPTASATERFYGVLFHELTHWTGAEHRLNREFKRERYGDELHAMEELTAELGAAFLCAKLNITPEPRADHAHYLASWLRVFKSDPRALFTAAARASDAAEYLDGFQGKEESVAA